MDSGQDLLILLDEEIVGLKKDVSSLKKHYDSLAIAENDYRKENSIQTLLAKDKGIQISIIDKIVGGLDSVCMYRAKRDIADGMVKSLHERIMVRKKVIDILKLRIWGTFTNND